MRLSLLYQVLFLFSNLCGAHLIEDELEAGGELAVRALKVQKEAAVRHAHHQRLRVHLNIRT